MKNLRKLAVWSALLLLPTLAPSAQAQWNPTDAYMSNNSYSSGWVNPYNNTMSNIYQSNMNLITQQAIRNSQLFTANMIGRTLVMGGRSKRLKAMKPRERSEAERFAKYQGTMYREKPNSKVYSQIAAVFAKAGGAKTSEVAPVFKVLFDVYRDRARQQNAPSTDLARTMAYCIAANYAIYNGKEGVDETPIAVLRAKIRTALSEDAKFRALSNAQKQQMNETLVILTHFVAYGAEDIAAKAPADKRAAVKAGFRKLAGLNLQGLLGVDPKRVSFGKEGLILKAA